MAAWDYSDSDDELPELVAFEADDPTELDTSEHEQEYSGAKIYCESDDEMPELLDADPTEPRANYHPGDGPGWFGGGSGGSTGGLGGWAASGWKDVVPKARIPLDPTEWRPAEIAAQEARDKKNARFREKVKQKKLEAERRKAERRRRAAAEPDLGSPLPPQATSVKPAKAKRAPQPRAALGPGGEAAASQRTARVPLPRKPNKSKETPQPAAPLIARHEDEAARYSPRPPRRAKNGNGTTRAGHWVETGSAARRQPLDETKCLRSGCSFFGQAATRGYCSVCFREEEDARLETAARARRKLDEARQRQAAHAAAAVATDTVRTAERRATATVAESDEVLAVASAGVLDAGGTVNLAMMQQRLYELEARRTATATVLSPEELLHEAERRMAAEQRKAEEKARAARRELDDSTLAKIAHLRERLQVNTCSELPRSTWKPSPTINGNHTAAPLPPVMPPQSTAEIAAQLRERLRTHTSPDALEVEEARQIRDAARRDPLRRHPPPPASRVISLIPTTPATAGTDPGGSEPAAIAGAKAQGRRRGPKRQSAVPATAGMNPGGPESAAKGGAKAQGRRRGPKGQSTEGPAKVAAVTKIGRNEGATVNVQVNPLGPSNGAGATRAKRPKRPRSRKPAAAKVLATKAGP